MTFINSILIHYTWYGIALLALLLTLFFVQLYYYAIAYNRIYNYRLMRRRNTRCDNPPISVIVAIRGESERFLDTELPTLLAQEYHTFEVVVIYIGSDMDYLRELERIRDNNAHMRLTKLGGNDRIRISTKQALNIGIKSAHYDNLLFTTSGAVPRSNEWIAYMAKGFERGMVVTAPSVPNFEDGGKIRTTLMRTAELHQWRNAFASAVNGELYCAPRSNFGFTHRLYDATRGYNHLALDNGDNDLYVQSIANAQRTAVVLSPHSVVVEERSSRWSEWLEYMRYNNSTRVHYPLKARMNGNRERGSRILFFLASICSLVVLPSELRIAVALLVLLRYAIVVWSTRRTAHKLGEKRIAKLYWLYDIVGPVLEVMTRARIDNSSKVWR